MKLNFTKLGFEVLQALLILIALGVLHFLLSLPPVTTAGKLDSLWAEYNGSTSAQMCADRRTSYLNTFENADHITLAISAGVHTSHEGKLRNGHTGICSTLTQTG